MRSTTSCTDTAFQQITCRSYNECKSETATAIRFELDNVDFDNDMLILSWFIAHRIRFHREHTTVLTYIVLRTCSPTALHFRCSKVDSYRTESDFSTQHLVHGAQAACDPQHGVLIRSSNKPHSELTTKARAKPQRLYVLTLTTYTLIMIC